MKIPSYKDILNLIKKGATIEAQEKIMELRETALALQEENLSLKEKLTSLEQRIERYENASGEFCPKCKKRGWQIEKTEKDINFGVLGGMRRTYKCSLCGFSEEKLVTQ